jgi:hypothetical protein
MTRTLSILGVALVGVSILSVVAVQAQTKAPAAAKCGVETWSTDKMSYVNVPCAGQEEPVATSGQTAKAPGAEKCGVETWSTDKMA